MRGNLNCPICGSNKTELFLERRNVPVYQNLPLIKQKDAENVPCADLSMRFCQQCNFVYNADFDSQMLKYNQDYDNTQTYSPFFQKYTDDLVQYLIEERNVRNCQIVEVGCGKGSFLRKMIEYPGANNYGFGFDPSYVGPLTDLGGRIKFHQQIYDKKASKIKVDVVICRHVIEHISQPLELLLSIYHSVSDNSRSQLFFETPCADWILRNNVIWDIFYEHCSLFTARSLSLAFQLAGFNVRSVANIFGGQYLWLEANILKDGFFSPDFLSNETPYLARSFGEIERKLTQQWQSKVSEMAKRDKVALWGAGAKGVTMANLIDPNRQFLDCVIDLNPNKQGCFIPGTGHPIISYQELPSRQIKSAILLNPNYHAEVLALLKSADIKLDLINEQFWRV